MCHIGRHICFYMISLPDPLLCTPSRFKALLARNNELEESIVGCTFSYGEYMYMKRLDMCVSMPTELLEEMEAQVFMKRTRETKVLWQREKTV